MSSQAGTKGALGGNSALAGDPQLLNPIEPLLAERIPALLISPARHVLVDLFIGRLVRPVWRIERPVNKEGFTVLLVAIDVFDDFLRVILGAVEARQGETFRQVMVVLEVMDPTVSCSGKSRSTELIALPIHDSGTTLEAPVYRLGSPTKSALLFRIRQMPLARHIGVVAGGAQ
jgi:hypothetical protein